MDSIKNMSVNKPSPDEIDVPDDLRHLIPGFLKRRVEEAAALQNFLLIGELEEIRKAAHKIKGHGLSYGFYKVSEMGRQMEAQAASNDLKSLGELLDEYQSYVLNLYKTLVNASRTK